MGNDYEAIYQYRFPDVETAARTTGFFFGEAFADRVRLEKWSRIPESTGFWWRKGKNDRVGVPSSVVDGRERPSKRRRRE